MSNSWGHRIEVLEAAVRSRKVPLNSLTLQCGTSGCKNQPTHLACYKYVTGRAGRIGGAGKQICSGHAAQFAKKYGIEYVGPEPCSIAKETRKPLTPCLICKKKRRDTWVVPAGFTFYREPTWPIDKPVEIPAGSTLCSYERIRFTRDLAYELNLGPHIQEPYELVTWYVSGVREAIAKTNAQKEEFPQAWPPK